MHLEKGESTSLDLAFKSGFWRLNPLKWWGSGKRPNHPQELFEAMASEALLSPGDKGAMTVNVGQQPFKLQPPAPWPSGQLAFLTASR